MIVRMTNNDCSTTMNFMTTNFMTTMEQQVKQQLVEQKKQHLEQHFMRLRRIADIPYVSKMVGRELNSCRVHSLCHSHGAECFFFVL